MLLRRPVDCSYGRLPALSQTSNSHLCQFCVAWKWSWSGKMQKNNKLTLTFTGLLMPCGAFTKFGFLGEKPPLRLYRLKPKFCMAGDLPELKLKLKFLGVTILRGGRISYFPINFCMFHTTVQSYSDTHVHRGIRIVQRSPSST